MKPYKSIINYQSGVQFYHRQVQYIVFYSRIQDTLEKQNYKMHLE